jgi:hypothetical protein
MTAPTQFALDRLRGTAAPPQANGEPVFANPTEARFFGMAHALAAAGVFDWDDFRDTLIEALARDEAAGAAFDYYRSFGSALERRVLAAGALERADLDARVAAVIAAAVDRDHGHDHPQAATTKARHDAHGAGERSSGDD